MLVIEGLTRRYGAKAAVDDVSLEIGAGGFIGVIGRSGAGKSTLLRMINRLEADRGAHPLRRNRCRQPLGRRAGELARPLRDDIPAVQSGWQARRAQQRPDGPPQPYADVARRVPALVGQGQGARVLRARAVDIASLAAQRADNLSDKLASRSPA